jgi:Tol biopolymer transport system component
MVLVVLIVPVIAGLLLIYSVKLRKSQPRLKNFKNTTITRVTDEGNAETAAISPDGNHIAYTRAENGKRSLWTKQLESGNRSQIVSPQDAYFMNASTFSADGFVYYTMNDKANPQGALFQVPSHGGAPKKLISRVSSSFAFSGDGKQIAFVRHHINGTKDELFVANADGSDERLLLSVDAPNWFGNSAPAWSPDNTILAVAYGSDDRNEVTGRNLGMTLILISVADGKLKPLSRSRWMSIGRVSWFHDGSGLLFVAQQLILSPAQLWQISYPRGESQQITNDFNSYDNFSLTQTQDDSKVLLVQSDASSNIWIATVGQSGSEKALTYGKTVLAGSRSLAWTVDGRIVFDANENGKAGLWSVRADDRESKALINNETEDIAPETSLDGRQLIFGSYRTGRIQVWRSALDGTNQQKLTSEPTGVPGFSLSPDGRWVVYSPFAGGIRKVPIDGGQPTELLRKGSISYPQMSADSRFVAYFFKDDHSLRPKIGIVNLDNGTLVKTIDLPLTAQPSATGYLSYRGWHWSPDGSSIVYVNTLGGVSNIWSQPTNGGPAIQITDFKSDRILSFAFSPDGRQLAFARTSHVSDAVLISSQRVSTTSR